MNDKEIKSLAREYAKSDDGIGKYDYLGNEYEAYLDGVEDAAQFLSSRYCIVEKSTLKREYGINKGGITSGCKTDNYDLVEYSKGRNSQLIDLFGSELFNKE